MKQFALLFLFVLLLAANFCGQENPSASGPGQLHGSFQILWQQYNEDSLIGALVPPDKTGLNAYGNLSYTYSHFTAGVRFESYLNSILGYPGRFKGTGIGARFVEYKNEGIDITAGTIYEQFGSGMALRTYWEPNLGIDNALDGVRVVYTPVQGLTLKGLYGMQRLNFDSRLENGEGLVRGLDGEIFFNDLVPGWSEKKTKVTVGGSFVSKYQNGDMIEKEDLLLQLPKNVGLFGARLGLMHGHYSLSGEFVQKYNDPNADNKFIYKKGQGILVNAGFSKKGLGITLQAKHIDNMAFRSERDQLLFDVPINYVPSITKQHTYNLAATLYPYATVLNGESGYSGEVFYTFKKESKLGGKYGTNLTVNYAAVNNMDTLGLTGTDKSVFGYETNSLGFGREKFVRDVNIELKKKVSKKFLFIYTYYYLEFNSAVTPVSVDFKGLIYADIHVLQLDYKLTPKQSISTQFQALFTEQDRKDWATVQVEYTLAPHWTIGALDQYNYGNDDHDKRIHYLYGTVGYTSGSSRISLGYGKRREGIFCIGGVCRQVPASNGLELTMVSTF